MAHQFLPLKEAAKLYEASAITLRRLVREVVKDPKHDHRPFVRPSPTDYEMLTEKNGPFEYEISTQLLDLKYKRIEQSGGVSDEVVADAQADVGSAAMRVLEETNTVLKDQLSVKDEQIRELNLSLRSMQQQQNATTMVLARLSERLPLLTEASPVQAEPMRSETAKTVEVEKRSRKKSGKRQTKKGRKRGVLGRLFRSRSK